MGLEERRKIKELEEETLPGRIGEIEEICGAAIQYEIDWPSFGGDLAALNFVDNLACHRVNMALRAICIDDMGKEAVRDTLKSVRIRCVGSIEEKELGFHEGALLLTYAFAAGLDGAFGDNEIRDVLLANL